LTPFALYVTGLFVLEAVIFVLIMLKRN